MDFAITAAKDQTEVVLGGSINESAGAELTRLRNSLVGAAKVTFDCYGVDSINSTGLRLWAEFLKSMKGRIKYEYKRCSVYFVDYANMSPALVDGALITSFFAPFRCPACNASSEHLLGRQSLPKDGFGNHSCAKCGGALEPEVDPSSYLDFLSPD